MLTHSRGLSLSPSQDWFMASISMFMRCHRPANKKKKNCLFFAVTQQERVLQCSTQVQTQRGDGVTLSSRWDSLLTSSRVEIFRREQCRLHWTSSSIYRICWEAEKRCSVLSHRCDLRASVQTCKTHPNFLLTFGPPAPRHTPNRRHE